MNFLETPNLECIQTVESIKLASAINNSCQRKGFTNKLKVFAQVNSSGEESESVINYSITEKKKLCQEFTFNEYFAHLVSI